MGVVEVVTVDVSCGEGSTENDFSGGACATRQVGCRVSHVTLTPSALPVVTHFLMLPLALSLLASSCMATIMYNVSTLNAIYMDVTLPNPHLMTPARSSIAGIMLLPCDCLCGDRVV